MKVYVLASLIIIAITFMGCAGRTINLNEKTVSQLSADLANQECEKIYGERPFLPEHYEVTFSNGRWQWGHMDPAGINGYSAKVSFKKDGTDKKVQVFLSTDVIPHIRRELRRQRKR